MFPLFAPFPLSCRTGFGDPTGEYWLGNEHIHLLTSSVGGAPRADPEGRGGEAGSSDAAGGAWRLRVELWDVGGRHWVATYSSFRVDSEGELYRLNLGRYSGNASDALR